MGVDSVIFYLVNIMGQLQAHGCFLAVCKIQDPITISTEPSAGYNKCQLIYIFFL